uniref:Uncharacterized protein n=1 Tax=Oryza nivara TaxID=4536 RepID=A0A0E0IWN7_ORYNI
MAAVSAVGLVRHRGRSSKACVSLLSSPLPQPSPWGVTLMSSDRHGWAARSLLDGLGRAQSDKKSQAHLLGRTYSPTNRGRRTKPSIAASGDGGGGAGICGGGGDRYCELSDVRIELDLREEVRLCFWLLLSSSARPSSAIPSSGFEMPVVDKTMHGGRNSMSMGEGIVDSGVPSPGQIQTMPSCSKHGNDRMRTLSNFVAGIFSHFPSVEYSHPEGSPEKTTGYQKFFRLGLYGCTGPDTSRLGRRNHDGEEVLPRPPIAVLDAESDHLKGLLKEEEGLTSKCGSKDTVVSMEQ